VLVEEAHKWVEYLVVAAVVAFVACSAYLASPVAEL
jgi:hypothetical protein